MNNHALKYICENANNDIPELIHHILTYLYDRDFVLYSTGSDLDIELIKCVFLNVYGTVEDCLDYDYEVPMNKKFIPSEEFKEYLKFMRL